MADSARVYAHPYPEPHVGRYTHPRCHATTQQGTQCSREGTVRRHLPAGDKGLVPVCMTHARMADKQ